MRLSTILTSSALALLISATAGSALAQGSSYNLIGFGLPYPERNVRIEALGGAGTALTDARVISDKNPALFSWLNRARFETSMRFEHTSSAQNSVEGIENTTRFDGFAFGAGLGSDLNFGISVGLAPMTDAAARITHVEANGDSVRYRSEGGISSLFLGVAAQPVKGIGVGAKLDVMFGNIRHLNEITFTDPTSAAGQFERAYAFNGLRPSLGLAMMGDSLTPSLAGIRFGVSFSPAVSLTTKRRTVITPTSTALDTTIEDKGVGQYPSELGLGIGVRLSDRYQVLADVRTSDFSTAFVFAPSTASGDADLKSSMRMSIGFERLANMGLEFGTESYWSRVGVRLGGHYYQLPVQPAGTGGVNEIALSLGLGLPITLESLMDLSLTAGQRTPVNANAGPKDTFARLGVSLSLSERWFVPSRND